MRARSDASFVAAGQQLAKNGALTIVSTAANGHEVRCDIDRSQLVSICTRCSSHVRPANPIANRNLSGSLSGKRAMAMRMTGNLALAGAFIGLAVGSTAFAAQIDTGGQAEWRQSYEE